jgi:S-methylmethionine-dependent homocysteine/selenocysteine methylase
MVAEGRLRDGDVLLLDGGTGSEVLRRHIPSDVNLWAVGPLLNAPEMLRSIHETYIAAGADIITTATFRTTPRALARVGMEARAEELTGRAVQVAMAARDRSRLQRPVLVAGSLAPLEDCYEPDAVPPDDVLLEGHSFLARTLAQAGVDLILVETMNTVREARAALVASLETGIPVWVSVTCKQGGVLLSGEPLKVALDELLQLSPSALLVNCCAPEIATAALESLSGLHTVPVGAYANNGHEDGTGWAFTGEYSPARYVEEAQRWLELGARIIGGCCGTTPEHIRALRESLPPP